MKPILPLICLLSLLPPLSAREALPPGQQVTRLKARTETIQLTNPYDYHQLLITATLTNGDKIDVTRIATLAAPTELLSLSSTGLVRPKADGTGKVRISLAGQQLDIPVTVSGQAQPFEVSFVQHVMPTLSKLGCNAGTCHGAQAGKNGFKLSLRGYDPLFDHRALIDDLSGRRFNRSAPNRSLMLMKPTGEVPHVGGAVMQVGEPNYQVLKAWIGQGVGLDLNAPRVERIEVFPKDPIVPTIGMKQQMAVLARYTDGSVRDVTAHAFVESSNTEVATVDDQALLNTVRRGEATMLARFEGRYAASTVLVMGDRSGFAWNEPPSHNWIDELVYDKLKRIKVLPSELCTDAEFIRRITLDLTGLPPTADAVRDFLADDRPTRVKRDELIDRLIGSEDFVENWTNKWADLLQVNRKFLGVEGAKAMRKYIHDAVALNKPYDQFVHEILTASGSTVETPAAGYFKVLRQPDEVMENTTQLFLAIRFNCNKCHDHPFERWTQDQYYHLAAFFAQVERKEDPQYKGRKLRGTAVEKALPAVEIIDDKNKGEVKHERTGAVAEPQFPYDYAASLPEEGSRREQLAAWLTDPANPYFAKSYVNRIWSYLLGVGLIEPIDDIRAGNPPSNPALLDRLTREFIDTGFDVRNLMRTICQSRTYQLSIKTNRWNEEDTLNYSHAIARRLPAEVLFDAIYQATGTTTRLPGLPPGARAVELLDSQADLPGDFLKLFGKPPRESACECERNDSVMLGPVLAMINGPVVAEAVKDSDNAIARLVGSNPDDDAVVTEIFLRVLNREPSDKEREAAKRALHSADADHMALREAYAERLKAVKEYESQVDARQTDWEAQMVQRPNWNVLHATHLVSANGASLVQLSDGSVLATGKAPDKDTYTFDSFTDLPRVTAIRLEALPDQSLPANGPGRAENGNLVLTEFSLEIRPADKPSEVIKVPLHRAKADFAQGNFQPGKAIDGNNKTGWALSPQLGKRHEALFEFKKPLELPKGSQVVVRLDHQFGGQHAMGRFRIALTPDKNPRFKPAASAALLKLLDIPASMRTTQQQAELTRQHRDTDRRYRELRADLGQEPPADSRVIGAQDLVWALINSPAFLFNH